MSKDKFCKLCSCRGGVYVSLSENNAEKMLEALTSFKLTDTEINSSSICAKCFTDLRIAYGIQQRIINVCKKEGKLVVYVQNVEGTQKPVLEETTVNSPDSSCLTLETETKKQFICSVCSEVFSLRYMMQVHKLQHETELPHTCHICGRKFKHSFVLSVHQRNHTNM